MEQTEAMPDLMQSNTLQVKSVGLLLRTSMLRRAHENALGVAAELQLLNIQAVGPNGRCSAA